MVSIFDISEGHVVINSNCLLIPELKLIMDTYENPIPVLGYVHFMADPKSPYSNLPEEDKEETVLGDYPGDYTTDDEPVCKALEKLKKLYETPSMRLLADGKAGLKTMGDYLRKAQITDGKDSNFATFQSGLKSIATINRQYKELEKDVEEELRVRGQGNLGYDEI